MSQAVARCSYCGANLSLADMRGQNCPYCHTVLAHHARAAEQAALVNQMLQQQGLAPQVPYQFGAPAPGVLQVSGPQVLVQVGAPGAPQNAPFPAAPIDELQRIAAEGQRRQAEFAAKAQALANAGAEDQIALALGAHYAAPFLRALTVALCTGLALLAAGGALWAIGLLDPTWATLGEAVGGAGVFALFLVRVAWAPRASATRRAAEEAWRKALPFELTGYFEALGMNPRSSCPIQVHLEWASPRVPAPAHVLGLVQGHDRTAAAAPGDPFGWVSPNVSGIVQHVHEIVERALLPLHKDYPLSRASLRRDY